MLAELLFFVLGQGLCLFLVTVVLLFSLFITYIVPWIRYLVNPKPVSDIIIIIFNL